MATTIKSHCCLGLTATLVREDDLIQDLHWLIGPKLYEANWQQLQAQKLLKLCQKLSFWCSSLENWWYTLHTIIYMCCLYRNTCIGFCSQPFSPPHFFESLAGGWLLGSCSLYRSVVRYVWGVLYWAAGLSQRAQLLKSHQPRYLQAQDSADVPGRIDLAARWFFQLGTKDIRSQDGKWIIVYDIIWTPFLSILITCPDLDTSGFLMFPKQKIIQAPCEPPFSEPSGPATPTNWRLVSRKLRTAEGLADPLCRWPLPKVFDPTPWTTWGQDHCFQWQHLYLATWHEASFYFCFMVLLECACLDRLHPK